MPVITVVRCCLLSLACLSALYAVAPQARAQAAGSLANGTGGFVGADPAVVITRTVNPRIAYRGVPIEDHPIHSQATTFPGQVFQRTLNHTIGQLLGDEALGQRGSAGIGNAGAAVPALTGTTTTLDGVFGPSASGGTSIGPSASVGGAVGGVTAGMGGMITNSVTQAMNMPASLGQQGGGP